MAVLGLVVISAALGCTAVEEEDGPQAIPPRDVLETALVKQDPVTRCNGACVTFRPVEARCRGDGVRERGLLFFACEIAFEPEGNDQVLCVAVKTVNGQEAFETRPMALCEKADR